MAAAGRYIDPSAGRITFREYAESWRAVQVHRPSTAAQIETNMRRHVYPRIGARRLDSIKPSDVQGVVRSLEVGGGGRPLAPAKIEVVYTWMSTIFAAAVRGPDHHRYTLRPRQSATNRRRHGRTLGVETVLERVTPCLTGIAPLSSSARVAAYGSARRSG